jgi:hypothetical protein
MKKINEEIVRIKSLMGVVNESVGEVGKKAFCSSFTNPTDIDLCRNFQKEFQNYKTRVKSKLSNLYDGYISQNDEVRYVGLKDVVHIYSQSQDTLNSLISLVPNTCERLVSKAKEEITKLDNRKILIYKRGDDYSYSYFNRLNTNMSALPVFLTEFSKYTNMSLSSIEDVVNEFLTGNSSQEFMNNVLDGNMTETSERLLDTITETRNIGIRIENDYKNYLLKNGIDFVDFSDDFGAVDFLGIDLLVKFPGDDFYSPVQVKSRPQDINTIMIGRYCQSGCNCYVVSPKGDGWGVSGCGGQETKPVGVQKISCRSITLGHSHYFCNGAYPNNIDRSSEYVELTDGSNIYRVKTNNLSNVRGKEYNLKFNKSDVL